MTANKKVEAYIKKHPKWSVQLTDIRSVLTSTELTEEVKWGAPSYSLNGKILVGFMGFKNHLGLWFHQGVFLKDDQKKLMNAQEGKTKALRQWRFTEGDVVDKELVLAYVLEAIENCKAGKEIKPERNKKELVIPEVLKEEIKRSRNLLDAFEKLSPGKQREYAEYISEAKREATKVSRLAKVIPMILDGIGLNDKYKKG